MTLSCSRRIALRVAREDRLPLPDRHPRDGAADHDLFPRASSGLRDRLGDQIVRAPLAKENGRAVRLQYIRGEPHDELEELLQRAVGEKGLPNAVHRTHEIPHPLRRHRGNECARVDRAAARDFVERHGADVDRRVHVGDAGRAAPAALSLPREDDVDVPELDVVSGRSWWATRSASCRSCRSCCPGLRSQKVPSRKKICACWRDIDASLSTMLFVCDRPKVEGVSLRTATFSGSAPGRRIRT